MVVPRPLLRLNLTFTAHESSSFKDSANPEMVPFVGITQHGVHIESHTVVPDGDLEAFGVDVQAHSDPSRFRVPLHVAQGLLHNAKQEDLGTREQNLFIAGDAELRLDMILGLIRGEIVSQGREQLHLVVVERAKIEDDLPCFLDGQLQLGFAFAQGGQAGFRIFSNQLQGSDPV